MPAVELIDVAVRVPGAVPLAGVTEHHPGAIFLDARATRVGIAAGRRIARPELGAGHGADPGRLPSPLLELDRTFSDAQGLTQPIGDLGEADRGVAKKHP